MARGPIRFYQGKARINLDELATVLRATPDVLREATTEGLQMAAHRLHAEVVIQIGKAKPYPAVDRGTLRSSVQTVMHHDGASVEVTAPYAPMIEYGTRPFNPPLEPLARWAARKGLANTEEEAKEIAYAIREKFSFEGMAPRRFMAKAVRQMVRKGVILKEIKKALARRT